MKPKALKLLEYCIDTAIDRGFHKAYKHNDNPTQPQIKEAINRAINDELFEWFTFEEDE